MPSAYLLARDKIEQAQAILDSEVWRDAQADLLIGLALERLRELDQRTVEGCLADDGKAAPSEAGKSSPAPSLMVVPRPRWESR